MLPTPTTRHVNYDHIYEPAEDSYLLLDTLSSESEKAWLRQRFPTSTPAPLAVEIGPGSGVVLAFLTAHGETILGRKDFGTLGVDVNRFACVATAETVRGAVDDAAQTTLGSGCFIDVACGDLATALRKGSVDILIFNPPYVPTEELPQQLEEASATLSAAEKFDRDSHLLALSYAGGADGMETTNRLLADLPCILSENGVAYILLCAQNKPAEVADGIRAWTIGKWHAEIAGSSGKKAGWEKLCILRIWRG